MNVELQDRSGGVGILSSRGEAGQRIGHTSSSPRIATTVLTPTLTGGSSGIKTSHPQVLAGHSPVLGKASKTVNSPGSITALSAGGGQNSPVANVKNKGTVHVNPLELGSTSLNSAFFAHSKVTGLKPNALLQKATENSKESCQKSHQNNNFSSRQDPGGGGGGGGGSDHGVKHLAGTGTSKGTTTRAGGGAGGLGVGGNLTPQVVVTKANMDRPPLLRRLLAHQTIEVIDLWSIFSFCKYIPLANMLGSLNTRVNERYIRSKAMYSSFCNESITHYHRPCRFFFTVKGIYIQAKHRVKDLVQVDSCIPLFTGRHPRGGPAYKMISLKIDRLIDIYYTIYEYGVLEFVSFLNKSLNYSQWTKG